MDSAKLQQPERSASITSFCPPFTSILPDPAMSSASSSLQGSSSHMVWSFTTSKETGLSKEGTRRLNEVLSRMLADHMCQYIPISDGNGGLKPEFSNPDNPKVLVNYLFRYSGADSLNSSEDLASTIFEAVSWIINNEPKGIPFFNGTDVFRFLDDFYKNNLQKLDTLETIARLSAANTPLNKPENLTRWLRVWCIRQYAGSESCFHTRRPL